MARRPEDDWTPRERAVWIVCALVIGALLTIGAWRQFAKLFLD